MARKKTRDIVWEGAALVRGKNPKAWRRDIRGKLIRYGSFERATGRYTWAVNGGKAVSTAQRV